MASTSSLKRAAPDADDYSFLRLRGGDGSRAYRGDDDEENEDEPSEDEMRPPQRRRTETSQITDGPLSTFQPGAIVRVKLRNFVTYSEAEFFLGPNLNMVIGPNGTGKSSLVCAICLGLGYPPSVLGRASALGEFVKHGSDEAELEVELQRKPEDAENYVVGLTIRREDNGRKFTINGSRSSPKDIQRLMRSLRIQIDNLCQFLPQDKVAEFAGLTPVELLEKTLHAAAPQEMIVWQQQLKDGFKTQKDAQLSTEKTREEVKRMEAKQRLLQADVDKLRERKAVQEQVIRLKQLRLIAVYCEAKNRYAEAKSIKKDATRTYKMLERSVAPALEAVNRKQDYHRQVKGLVTLRRRELEQAVVEADKALSPVENASNKITQTETAISTETDNFKEKKRRIGTLKKEITELKAKHAQKPREFKAADFNLKIRELDHQKRDKEEKLMDLGEKRDATKSEGVALKQEKSSLEKELADLDSQEGQLLNQLKKMSPDVAKGWAWLKDHQNEFEKEVFGPPVLTCSVKDRRYSDLVQSMLGESDFFCFTTQSKHDHKKLSDYFHGSMGLAVTIRSCFRSLDSFKPPLPREQLSELGFDGYVTDYLDGPEPVMAMLCAEKRLHQSALSLSEISDEQFERIQRDETINFFAAGQKLYRTTRRKEYGPGAVSTRVTGYGRGRFWTDQPVDSSEKTELERKIKEAEGKLAELTEKYKAIGQEGEAVRREVKELEAKKTNLMAEKNALQAEFTQWNGLPDKIDAKETVLDRTKKELDDAKVRRADLLKQLDEATIELSKAVIKHHDTLGGIRTARQKLLEAQVWELEADSDVVSLKDKNAEITTRLEGEKAKVAQAVKDVEEFKKTATKASTEAAEFLTEENREEMTTAARGKTVAEFEALVGAEQAKLEMIEAGNPQALEEYERYAQKIEQHRNAQENQEAKLAEINAQIEEIKSQWEPRLDQLVGQINDAFSYNFEQITCAGEVGVHKDEDFDKWAIDIRVKFRQGETLQRLDQHRQSGGERAVSTIFYLMALQALAQAPFRVVDEINQGMDPRNERMVHERMVEVACREHTSQYFLITPKLLSGLRYDPRMKVHVIISGERVDPEGTTKMNFSKFVQIQKRLKAEAAGHGAF
ncbi:putative structural maintenance of chromosomes protein [Triangularia verruculosa]|uniref:Structural maintenance of chromosomes protein 5 n=1 Tax=Triangularia verruculosa TaxID=2587418 RepID=A0AAN7AUZ6_9PEZI|nr:putative structural maintenance of chromosomes protein [Triangularia verruculosa]